MPERVPLRLDWDPGAIRAEVIDNAANVDLIAGGGRARAAAVPLFRHAGSGGLEQAIRIEASPGLTGAVVSVRADSGTELDRLTIEGQFGHLFVPEVDSARLFELTLEANGETASGSIVIEPQRKWSIHLAHHSHFDYGYTDQQPRVLDNHLRFIDAAVDLVDATTDWPEAAKFRWNIEVTYPLQKWMANRPASLRKELLRQVRDGRMEIAALPFSMHSEAYSIDEMAWGLKYAQRLRDEHGIEIVSAFQSDVPGAVIGLLTLLTEADIRYFNVAHNYAGRSVPFRVGGQELTRPFWWRRANGKRLLVWHTDTAHGMAYMDGNLVGLADGEAAARAALPDYLAALAGQPYPYGGASFGWSGLPAGLPVTKQPYPHDILHFRIQSSIADNAPPGLEDFGNGARLECRLGLAKGAALVATATSSRLPNAKSGRHWTSSMAIGPTGGPTASAAAHMRSRSTARRSRISAPRSRCMPLPISPLANPNRKPRKSMLPTRRWRCSMSTPGAPPIPG